MKRVFIYILSALLLVSAAVGTVSCTPADANADTAGAETSTRAETSTGEEAPTRAEGTAPEEAETPDPSRPRALDFVMKDEAGEDVRLSDLFGKPIVLNFWASWCPPCKAEMPDFEAMYKKYGDDVIFIMLNLTDGQRETVELAQAHVASCGYTFPVYFDTAYEGATAYRITSIPQTVLIDEDGCVVGIARGMLDAATLENGILSLLGE